MDLANPQSSSVTKTGRSPLPCRRVLARRLAVLPTPPGPSLRRKTTWCGEREDEQSRTITVTLPDGNRGGGILPPLRSTEAATAGRTRDSEYRRKVNQLQTNAVIGPQTTAAWRKFQQNTGLAATRSCQWQQNSGRRLDAPAQRSVPGSSSRARESRSRPPQPPTAPAAAVAPVTAVSPRRPIASPRAPCAPKILRSARPSTLPKNICRKGLTARLRARFRCSRTA